MNEANAKAVQLELGKAAVTEREAAHAIEGGFVHMGANRLYYAVYHYIKAILLASDVQTKSHKGAQNQFRVHFTNPGIFPPSDAKLVADLWKARQDADYAYLVDTDIETLKTDAERLTEFGKRCVGHVERKRNN